MSKVLSILKKKGLVTREKVESSIFDWSIGKVHKLREELSAAAEHEGEFRQVEPVDPLGAFRFHASASFRGDKGCIEWRCRLAKIRALARYAALYCDNMIVPLRLHYHYAGLEDEENARHSLAGTLMSILALRPLVEARIVSFVPDHTQMCGGSPPMPRKITRTANWPPRTSSDSHYSMTRPKTLMTSQ